VAEFVHVDSNDSGAGDDVVDGEVLAACQPLTDSANVQSVEFDGSQLNCLYYLGGYVVSRVKKNDTTCESCLASLISSDYRQELDGNVTKLVHAAKQCLI